MTAVPATPPNRWVEPADLVELAHLLPPSAVTLIRVVGAPAALALMQNRPGVLFTVPLRSDANPAGVARWRLLADAVGIEVIEAEMLALTAHYGGGVLEVPVCRDLILHKRNRWIRARFDQLTSLRGPALSAWGAVQEINLALSQSGWPLTLREVQKVVNAPGGDPGADTSTDPRQLALPGLAHLQTQAQQGG